MMIEIKLLFFNGLDFVSIFFWCLQPNLSHWIETMVLKGQVKNLSPRDGDSLI
jgi:hypothetical protein